MGNIAKYGKFNTFFQIAYFIGGACHTPDGAYFALKELWWDRKNTLSANKAKALEVKAERLECKSIIDSQDSKEWEKMKAQARLDLLDGDIEFSQHLISQAEAEFGFLDDCLNALKPKCKYADMPESMAHEMSQREEWLLELRYRAENYLCCGNQIPAAEFDTMRLHPDFASHILPHIRDITIAISKNDQVALAKLQDRKVKTADSPIIKLLMPCLKDFPVLQASRAILDSDLKKITGTED